MDVSNRDVGRYVVRVANSPIEQHQRGYFTAEYLLDVDCEPFRGRDVFFDGKDREAIKPGNPVGNLLIEVFDKGTNHEISSDEGDQRWFNLVYEPFKHRYAFG